MKYRIALILFLSIVSVSLTAQSWTMFYEGENGFDYSWLNHSITDDMGNTVFVGTSGSSADSRYAFIMSIRPDGTYATKACVEEGVLSATLLSIITLPNGNYFTTGIKDTTEGPFFDVIVFDPDLNIVSERQYAPEGKGEDFYGISKSVLDCDGNIVSTAVQMYDIQGYAAYHSGMLYRFTPEGDTIQHRDLYSEESPLNMGFTDYFCASNLFYDSERQELLYFGVGLHNYGSLEYFDEDFNLVRAYKLEVSNSDTCYAISGGPAQCHLKSFDEDLIIFDDDINQDLFASKVSLDGKIEKRIVLRPMVDTIEDPALACCMAEMMDGNLCYYFDWYTFTYDSGVQCAYLINDDLEIVGSYFDDSGIRAYPRCIASTNDGGCIMVSDSMTLLNQTRIIPYFIKLMPDDFTMVPLSVQEKPANDCQGVYPNPAKDFVNISIQDIEDPNLNIRICDATGRMMTDRKVVGEGNTIVVDISQLKPGIYVYSIYNTQKELLIGKFIKE